MTPHHAPIFRLLALLWLAASAVPTATALAAEPTDVAQQIADVRQSLAHRYGAHDDKGHSLDCLNPFQDNSGAILGVYHYLKDDVFHLALAESDNGIDWRFVCELDQHASQGQLYQTPAGEYLLAYEKDAPNSCWIRITRFANLEALRKAESTKSADIKRLLAPTAEGTPMIDQIIHQRGLEIIKLRFHYYRQAHVDRLAHGQLIDMQRWTARPDDHLNQQFTQLGGQGNVGSRDLFTWSNTTYCLQEVQLAHHDWSSWRVYLCQRDGKPLTELKIQTHGGSQSFANPHAEALKLADGTRALLVTAFMPSQGSAPGESGELLYLMPLPAADE